MTRIVRIIPIIVVLTVFAGGVAQAAPVDPEAGDPTSDTFTMTGVATQSLAGGGPCWYWDSPPRPWANKNPFGQVQYHPFYEVTWCANAARTKVVAPFSHFSTDLGGYWQYLSTDRYASPRGYSRVNITVTWRFKHCVTIVGDIVCANKTASFRGSVHPNGVIRGEFYKQ